MRICQSIRPLTRANFSCPALRNCLNQAMTQSPLIVRTLRELRGQIWEWRGAGETIGFVPTMGALHSGHLSLITLSKTKTSKTVASIFVNPTQFAPGEDFESYPRTEDDDIAKLASAGCDLVYIPERDSMYNAHHATHIKVGGVADNLETDHRPTFFEGVALVVTKLLNRVAPDAAIFGEKDYQQLATIRRLVEDLDMPIEIIGAPIARDEHGLALSSRNKYFDAGGINTARMLSTLMFDCADKLARGEDIQTCVRDTVARLERAGFTGVDYVTVASVNSLTILHDGKIDHPARLLIAAHCPKNGKDGDTVRLIDNCAI